MGAMEKRAEHGGSALGLGVVDSGGYFFMPTPLLALGFTMQL